MVRLEEHKAYSLDQAVESLPLPSRVWIPLIQHLGKACVAQVKLTDKVLTGQKIAAVDAHVYAPIHASISGEVKGIVDWPHPVLGRSKAVFIESDGLDKPPSHPAWPAGRQATLPGRQAGKSPEEINKLTVEQIRNIIFEAGIVGMGGAGFPTHIKLNPPRPVENLIINAAECEPYLTADYRLMLEKTEQIIRGVDLVGKCLGVKNMFIAIEDNKPLAIKAFDSVLGRTPIEVVVLKTQYPQGGEKQLVQNILHKEVPSGKIPFEVGTVVQNIATVFAVYEAAYLNKPLYERVVTVTGSCISKPKNLLVRLGTPIKELIQYCGPLKEEPAKIIIGGPMMGISQYTDQVPVIKTTTGIILMNKKEVQDREELACIRCGACVRACPTGLMPCIINLAAQKELWQQAQAYAVADCIECGCCNYVCPANRNMVQSFKRAKLEIAR